MKSKILKSLVAATLILTMLAACGETTNTSSDAPSDAESRATSQPESQLTSQPTSQPESQPTSQPESDATSSAVSSESSGGNYVADNTTFRIQTDTSSLEEVYNVHFEFTNPLLETNQPDPELHRFSDSEGNPVYYLYSTGGSNIHCSYSTDNMKTWTQIKNIIDMSTITWATAEDKKIWAPSCLYYNGKYYLSFSNGDSHATNPKAGINIAVSDSPSGPFVAVGDGPIVYEHDDNYSGMALIDQDLFLDEDGQIYMYYGGGGTCFCVKINPNFKELVPFDDGETYKKMTGLSDYMEAPYMIKRGSTYYLMYSKGVWSNDSYGVCYQMSDSPIGPFSGGRQILSTSDSDHKGPGHHSTIYIPENNQWLICYHRYDHGDSYRSACIDRLVFNPDGTLRSVVQTDGWTTDDDFSRDESNLAFSATAFDSGLYGYYGAGSVNALNDEDMNSYWQHGDAPRNGTTLTNCWVGLEFDKATRLQTIVIEWESGTKCTENGFKLQVSDDGKTWKDVTPVSMNYDNTTTIVIDKVTAKYFRIYMTECTNDKYSPKIFEIRAYDKLL